MHLRTDTETTEPLHVQIHVLMNAIENGYQFYYWLVSVCALPFAVPKPWQHVRFAQ